MFPLPMHLGYYDAAWMATLLALMADDDRDNPETASTVLQWVTEFYSGATEPFVLNEFDDRENTRYDFW